MVYFLQQIDLETRFIHLLAKNIQRIPLFLFWRRMTVPIWFAVKMTMGFTRFAWGLAMKIG